MKGFVPTPPAVVDLMVTKLFKDRPPDSESSLLDPGCGEGAFIQGVVRWCRANGHPLPRIVGIESDPAYADVAARRFAGSDRISVRLADFLGTVNGEFDYVIGNPPYVPITQLSADERAAYRRRFETAQGRFDLYLLFYEQALGLLKPSGRLVFITPEKFLYVKTAAPLRALLHLRSVQEFHFLDESTFQDLVTYPLVTTVAATAQSPGIHVVHRDGRARTVPAADFSQTASWLPAVLGSNGDARPDGPTLKELCTRISCGVATGADAVYVVRDEEIGEELWGFAYPTVGGRQIAQDESLEARHRMLIPYTNEGELLPEPMLGALGQYLAAEERYARLIKRSCADRKPWYAFHENPPLSAMLRPKLLCKDITPEPFFVEDRAGEIVPRHSVYYIVPKDPAILTDLVAYLNSDSAKEWLRSHCQRAANGYLRLQSHVLKQLPVPSSLACDGRASSSQDAQLEAELA